MRKRIIPTQFSFRLDRGKTPKGVSMVYGIPKKRDVLYSDDKERVDAVASRDIRQVMLEISKKKDGQQAFFLLADFFGKHPIETLGPRTVKEIALVLSRGKVTFGKTAWLLELLEISLITHSRAEVLCDKLKRVGFGQDKKSLKRARNLHLIIKYWEMSLLNEKRSHGIAA